MLSNDDDTIASLYVLGFAAAFFFFLIFITKKKKKKYQGPIHFADNGFYDLGCNCCNWKNIAVEGSVLNYLLKRDGYFCRTCGNPLFIRRAEIYD